MKTDRPVFKKCTAILAMIVSGIFLLVISTVSVNAQFFVGGSVLVSSNSTKHTDTADDYTFSSFAFGISPSLGYWLNDRIAVGASASVGYSIQRMIPAVDNPNREKSDQIVPRWGFGIFGRYKLLKMKKFSLNLDSSVGIDRYSTKNRTSSGTKKINSGSIFGINATPSISYDLSDKFTVMAWCSFLNLGFSSDTGKNEETGAKSTYNQFNFSVDDDLFYSLGGVHISFTYNF